jgi:phytoene desaturase
MPKKVVVIGAGFAGMSAATYLADSGYEVTLLEKHNLPGGRARKFEQDGFTFDMGPSWYWMPDVFESYFARFGKKVSDYYSLTRLDPSYEIVFDQENVPLPASLRDLYALFDKYENGAGDKLKKYLEEAKYKYDVGINNLVYQPGQSILELINLDVIKGIFKLDVFSNMRSHIQKQFQHPYLQKMLEFPILFLGALAKDTPALYSLMNYGDIVGGTWYPTRGMYSIVEAFYQLAIEKGVKFIFDADVNSIDITDGKVSRINYNQLSIEADLFISGADYEFTERLLPQSYRNYSNEYWKKRKMAPSCILFYIGINKKLKNINHHTLFFDSDFDLHADEIYTNARVPENPLFYVCAASQTDPSCAPEGHENLFFLIPIAAGLEVNPEIVQSQFQKIITRFEKYVGEKIVDHIIFRKDFTKNDFVNDYNAYKGNAYGLANILMQTANLKPSITNKKLSNLLYTGQLTVPGPGVPPSIISGLVVGKYAKEQK